MERHTAADYARAILGLLPRGRIWGDDGGGPQSSLAAGCAEEAARVGDRAAQLLEEAFPASTSELLAEWEATLGLPDPCVGVGATIQERRNAVVAKLAASGGQSRAHFVSLAAALGFAVTIEEFAPARVGLMRAGDPVQGDAWAHHWRVHAPETTVFEFRAGRSAAGEPLRRWGNAALECAVSRTKPAHTTVSFAYDL